MDPTRDNPILRFTAFWWALGTFFAIAVVIAAIYLFDRQPAETPEEAAAEARYKIREQVDQAQKDALAAADFATAIPAMAKQLAASKPVAVEKPEQVVPGSPTAEKLAAEPADSGAGATDVDALTPAAGTAPDAAVMELGKTQFLTCAACHGQNGEGGPIAPPLAGSEWVAGPVSNLIRIQLRGLEGPLTVAGKEYNFAAGMTPLAFQTDEQIAAVLTYVRNSFGNTAPPVLPEQVKMLRSEVGKPMLKADDLIKP